MGDSLKMTKITHHLPGDVDAEVYADGSLFLIDCEEERANNPGASVSIPPEGALALYRALKAQFGEAW